MTKKQKDKAFIKKLKTLTIGGKAVGGQKPCSALFASPHGKELKKGDIVPGFGKVKSVKTVGYLATMVHHPRHKEDESRAFAV